MDAIRFSEKSQVQFVNNPFNFVPGLPGSIVRSANRKFRERLSVLDFGAYGDGIHDDTDAVKRCVAYTVVNGGTIYFPSPGIYLLSDQINIVSNFHVNVIAEMTSNETFLSGDGRSYIGIIAPIAGSLFRFDTYNGGIVQGLYIKDPTGFIGGVQGVNAVTAAIELVRFTSGHVKDISFDSILGSAIKAEFVIRTNFDRIHIRDCGAPARPAVMLEGVNLVTGEVVQGVNFSNLHIEVCRSAPYVSLNHLVFSSKFDNVQCECDTLIAASNQIFFRTNGTKIALSNVQFNRNNNISLYADILSDKLVVSNAIFESAPVGVPKVSLNGGHTLMENAVLIGETVADTGTSIDDVVGGNHFDNCFIYGGGNVKLGQYSSWTGGGIFNLFTTEPYALLAALHSSVTGTHIESCLTSGGLRALGFNAITGNVIEGNLGIGLRSESATAALYGNVVNGNTGGDVSFTGYPAGYIPNANYVSDGAIPLKAVAAWNPAALNDGASENMDIAVAGAAPGDMVLAGFPMIAGGVGVNGLQLTASVKAANAVNATITNHSGGIINLDAGNLTICVIKA